MTQDHRRCENLACLCNVSGAQTACSPACETEARAAHEVLCTCGHIECAKASDAQLHGGTGRERSPGGS